MTHNFQPVDGQAVRALTGRHAQQIGNVVGSPTSDGWYLVLFGDDLARGPFGRYPAEELEAVRTDDTVPASEVEIVKHLTGIDPTVESEPSSIDEYRCPVEGCDFHILAAGPVDIDEPDPFQESIDEHRRGHEPEVDVFRCRVCGFTTAVDEEQDAHVRAHVMEDEGMHPGWGDIGAIDLMLAAHGLFGIFDFFPMSRPPAEVAAKLRAVARVLDGGAS